MTVRQLVALYFLAGALLSGRIAWQLHSRTHEPGAQASARLR